MLLWAAWASETIGQVADAMPNRGDFCGLGKGWYEVSVDETPGYGIARNLRVDIGRGLSAYHSVALWPRSGGSAAVVRLFRVPLDAELVFAQGGAQKIASLASGLNVRRLGRLTIAWRRLAEAAFLMAKGWSINGQPRRRRYLRFRGFFSFPARGMPQPAYQDWIEWDEAPASLPAHEAPPDLTIVVQAGGSDVEGQIASVKAQLLEADSVITSLSDRLAAAFLDTDATRGEAPVQTGHAGASSESRRSGWVVFVRRGAFLHADALARIRDEGRRYSRSRIMFGASDAIGPAGARSAPVIRPGFSMDSLIAVDLLGPVIAVDLDALSQALHQFEQQGSLDDLQLISKLAEREGPEAFHAIPHVLAHKKEGHHVDGRTPRNAASSKASCGLGLNVAGEEPLVSIVIPSRDKATLLEAAVASILSKSTYSNFELLIVDHESTEPAARAFLERISQEDRRVSVQTYTGSFNFSDMCNRAAQSTRGDLLAFVNNDVEIVSPTWIEALGRHALRPSAGCVGGLLIYPDGSLQHAGIVLGMGGIAGHYGRGLQPDDPRLVLPMETTRNVGAVSAACLMIKRSLFGELGGFDAVNLPVAFNDVDLCLRCLEMGLQNYWVPEAVLMHHESASRRKDVVSDMSGRFGNEYRHMRALWGRLLDDDPFYSSMLSLAEPGVALRI